MIRWRRGTHVLALSFVVVIAGGTAPKALAAQGGIIGRIKQKVQDSNAVDGSKVLAQLGESGSAADHYFVRPVPATAKGPICGGGFAMPRPSSTMRIAINLANPGAPLPVTCRWTALVGVPDPGSPIGFDMVWSDTVSVQVTIKP